MPPFSLHDTIVSLPVIAAAPGSPHSILIGASLGLTLWMILVNASVILFTGGAAVREVRRLRPTLPSIVCIMAVSVSAGQLIFSARRIALLVSGDPAPFRQPDWAIVEVIVGSVLIAACPVAAMVWRAHCMRRGLGRIVAAVNGALLTTCLLAGAYAASW